MSRVLLAALAYFASARLGYAFAVPHGVVTLWPPAGVMLGLLLVSERRHWPALLAGGVAGCLVSDLTSGLPAGVAVAASLANLSESALAAWVVTWRLGTPVSLSSLRAITVFAGGATVLTNAFTAILGGLVLHLGFGTPFALSWFTWWVGDGLGMLVVAPLVVSWSRTTTAPRSGKRIRWVEAAALFTILVALAQLALGPVHVWLVSDGSYLLFPVLFWAAWRLGMLGASTAVLIVAWVASWNAALDLGPFATEGSSSTQVAMRMYAFLGIASLSTLIAAAVLEERAAAAGRLRQTENRYRDMFEANPHAMWVFDDETRAFLAVNDAAIRRYGYSREEFLALNVSDIRPEEDRPAFFSFIRQSTTDTLYSGVWRHRTKSGNVIDVEITSHQMRFNGRPARFVLADDLTDRHRAEQELLATQERLSRVLASSGAVIFELTLDPQAARLGWISENVTRILGYTVEEALDPHWWSANIHPDDRQRLGDRPDHSDDSDGSSEFRFRHRDGGFRWLREDLRLLKRPDDETVGAVGAWLDITEWKQLQEQFYQSQKMEAIGRLAGGIAHDFNNLLTVILGELDELSASPAVGDGAERDSVVAIGGAAERAASLTRQLLSFSRRQLVEPAVISLNDTVSGVDKMLRRLIGEDVRLTLRLDPALHQTVADAGQVEQILVNLVVNARDAMPDGGAITIETSNTRFDESYAAASGSVSPGDFVVCSVTDSGTGMSDEVKAHLFEPFYTTKERGKGTGLGLATCYAIARQFGGHIEVVSEVGTGCTMRVCLPAVDVAPVTATRNTEPTATRGKETILLVEDEPQVRHIASRLLRRLGYTVHEAANAEEALVFLERFAAPLDLMLTDVVLPGMGGRELVERVAQLRPALRVLFSSGYSDDVMLQHRLLGKGIALLQKPYSVAALAAKVRQVLDRPAGSG